NGLDLLKGILFAEIIAKFSMVLMASIGRSAALGSNSPFVSLMKDKKKLATAAIITLIPLIIFGGNEGMIMFGVGITITLFLVGLASRSFGGITGDVLGATNELTRLATILAFVSI
ncbi:MAG: adenosylcobinamide-GDP ribazoletransferase, partial [Nitrosopumilaceae archaeon]|nr:adenosylcobinamide-GDP ribazoletransferase [Nitrosopumilaceae archaeon]